MKCIITDESHDKDHQSKSYKCPDVYCPRNSQSPNNGNYTASLCIYTENFNSTTGKYDYNYDCPKQDFCHMKCSEINSFSDGYFKDGTYKAYERGSISTACQLGNVTDAMFVDQFRFWDQKPPNSSGVKTNLSLVLPIFLIALMHMPFMKKLFRN